MKANPFAPKGHRLRQRGGFAAFAIRNPHLIVVPCLILAILGTLAVASLPKDLLPPANLPAVQILSFYTGMPVDEISKSITERYEIYTSRAIGMERQESKSILGVSAVRNYFNSGTDLNTAIAQTTSLVMSVLRKLPPGTQPPLILPFDPMASVPLTLVAVSGDLPESTLNDIGRYEVENAVQAVPGAMAPTVMGGTERQIVVYLDPKKLDAYNVSPIDVVSLLGSYNTFVPSGDVKIGQYDYQILSNGLAEHVSDMNDFPLRSDNGVTVYLKQVGTAKDAHTIRTNVVRVNGKPQVYVPVYRQPGANSIQVVDQIRESMRKLEERLGNVKLTVVADQSEFIRHAIHSITEEALIGGGLAALLVFLFLGNPRATGGVMLSLPLSLLCAFVGLKAVGETLNAMTLGGLALSIGVLVDNSIVVLENIMQKISQGVPPEVAAASGASEVMAPVFASTAATLIVFFPVVFLSGVVKILFSSLAKSVMFAMLGSFVVASSVIPLFCSRFLGKPQGSGGILRRIEESIHGFSRVYANLLYRAIQHRRAILVLTGASLLALSTLAFHLGTELFPRADAGSFVVDARLASGTRIETTEKFAERVEAKLREWIPAHDLSMVITNAGLIYGFPAAFTQNSGTQDVFFNLELTADRNHSTQYYAKIVRERFQQEFPEAEIGVELGGLMSSALNGGLRSPIDVQIEGKDLAKSHVYAEEIAAKARQISGAVDVRIQQREDMPQLKLDVNRKKAGALGLTPDEVVKNVVSAVSGSSTFNPSIWVDPKSGIDYFLGVQVPEEQVSSFDELKALPVTGHRQDRVVPLRALATLSEAKGPSEINHVNLREVVDLYADAEGRDIGGVSRDLQRAISEIHLDPGYTATIRGEISEMQRSAGSLGGGFLLAAALVYLILVMQFRSFALPAIIMVTVPMGLVGIIVMLVATHTYFSIQAAIGAIFMIGIAVANGVLLIEFILHQVKHLGAGFHEWDVDSAIVAGAQARLRPILMTSLASILGLVPMALGVGHGSEANIPLGRAVIGGQLLSTALTLFIVPLLYKSLRRDRFAGAKPVEALKTRSEAVRAEEMQFI